MTDWMPMVLVLGVGTLGTLWSLIQAVERGANRGLDLSPPRRWFLGTALVTGALYLVYLLFGERWLWY